MYKEELLNLINGWSSQQLDQYIDQLETRLVETHALLKELKTLRRKKQMKRTPENGTRDGR